MNFSNRIRTEDFFGQFSISKPSSREKPLKTIVEWGRLVSTKGTSMYKYFAIIFTLFFSPLSCADPKPPHIEFKMEQLPFGMKQKRVDFCEENREPENIGCISIVSKDQLSIFDSPIFASIDISTLPSEVGELCKILAGIKEELTQSLENVVMLGDLYVYPKFRGQGYAKRLIQATCNEIFDTTQAQYIVIAPGPFEFENGVKVPERELAEFEEKKNRLIKLYQTNGFVACQGDAFFMYLKKDLE